MSSLRVLVTGADGFTGRYVVPALRKASFEPCVLVSNLCKAEDLQKEISDIKPNAVLHLAGIAYVGHGNPADFYHVNLIGTLNLLQAIEKAGSVTGSVVLASSANIYGSAYQGVPIKELFLPCPMNDYAVSKLAMEEMASLWRQRLPICVVRPFNYTGVGQATSFAVPKIVEAFKKRETELNLGNLSVSRDFSDVRDVARWYCEILQRKIAGETVNFCSGKEVSLKDIISLCSKFTEHSLTIKSDVTLCRTNELASLCGDRQHLEHLLGTAALPQHTMQTTLHWMLSSPA